MRGIDVKIDRERQTVTFEQNGHFEILTVDQLFDEIETMFARPRAPTIRTELAGAAVNQKNPGRPQEAAQPQETLGTWLRDCDQPLSDPFKNIDQAITEPTRQLIAAQTEDQA